MQEEDELFTQGVSAVVYEYCRLGSLEDALMCRGKWRHKPLAGQQRLDMLYHACMGLRELQWPWVGPHPRSPPSRTG